MWYLNMGQFVELLYYLCEDGIEKFCLPPDPHLSSLGKPLMMPICDPRDRFFYLTLMIDSYILFQVDI